MKTTVVLPAKIIVLLSAWAVSAGPPEAADGWSEAIRRIEARVSLVEKPKINGTRTLVPYLELRNVGDSAYPIKISCSRVKFELVAANGKVIREGWILPRSGPHADPGIVSLPHDSSIRVGMHCTNWGVPKDAAAMIATDSGAWVLKAEEKGTVFLRATLTAKPDDTDPDRMWHGTIQLPPVKVDWKD